MNRDAVQRERVPRGWIFQHLATDDLDDLGLGRRLEAEFKTQPWISSLEVMSKL